MQQVRQWMQQAMRASGSQAVILIYHRVFELPSDPQLLCVGRNHFAEHLEHLIHHYNVITLHELSEGLKEGKVPDRAVVVTFDDGYADNLHEAKPLLDRYDVPATVFVTTGCIGQEYEFWWDELDRLLLQPGTLPQTGSVSVGGHTLRWELGEVACYTQEDFERCCRWNIVENSDPTPRQRAYRALCQLLRPLSETQRRDALRQLRSWAGLKSTVRATHRGLSHDEVYQLAESGLVDIGSHGMTHSVLLGLSVAAQLDELQRSKARLEEITGDPVTSFSYPYGSRLDYTRHTVSLVRKAGFACACSNFAGIVGPTTDVYQLPRHLVRDWDGEEFARRLRGWIDA